MKIILLIINIRLNILLPEGTAVDDDNGGAFGAHHKVYDIWLDDFERRGTLFYSLKGQPLEIFN